VERLIFEETFTEAPSISDHGTVLVLANQFGDCRYLMTRDQIRNLQIPSVNQILHHDSISMLIKRAIQRGMAISQVRRAADDRWKPANERIIQDITKLASLTLEKPHFEDLCKTFEDTTKSIQFMLSNKEEFKKIQTCCDKMQDYLRRPLNISLEKSAAKKVGIRMANILGGLTLAYLAGPGMVVVVVEAVSMASVAGAVGGLEAGLVTQSLLTDRLADENYEQVLAFVTFELFKKFQNMDVVSEEDDCGQRKRLAQETSDLREDGSTFNLEKALLRMYDAELGVGNFAGCTWSGARRTPSWASSSGSSASAPSTASRPRWPISATSAWWACRMRARPPSSTRCGAWAAPPATSGTRTCPPSTRWTSACWWWTDRAATAWTTTRAPSPCVGP
jgi:hypothetical protein